MKCRRVEFLGVNDLVSRYFGRFLAESVNWKIQIVSRNRIFSSNHRAQTNFSHAEHKGVFQLNVMNIDRRVTSFQIIPEVNNLLVLQSKYERLMGLTTTFVTRRIRIYEWGETFSGCSAENKCLSLTWVKRTQSGCDFFSRLVVTSAWLSSSKVSKIGWVILETWSD